jgi:protein CrcB
MFSYFVVAIGGALGSVGRFWLSGAIAQKFGETFPAGTLLVNISGSLIIGFFAALTGPDGRIWSSPSFRRFFMIGVLGGYTRFLLSVCKHSPSPVTGNGSSRRSTRSDHLCFVSSPSGSAIISRSYSINVSIFRIWKFHVIQCCCAFSSVKAIAGITNHFMKRSF